MARNFVNATDRINYGNDVGGLAGRQATLSLWFKTTYAGAYAVGISHWTSASRNGYSFQIRSGKVFAEHYAGSPSPPISFSGAITVNDGLWHHCALTIDGNTGGSNGIYVDGALDTSATHASGFLLGDGQFMTIGDPYDSFWPTLPFDVAEVARFTRHLSLAEIASLAKGFSPRVVSPADIDFYVPLIRDKESLRVPNSGGVTGTTVVDHPPLIMASGMI